MFIRDQFLPAQFGKYTPAIGGPPISIADALDRFTSSQSLPLEGLGVLPDTPGVDQVSAFKAALAVANGRPLTGLGKTYYLGNTALGPNIDVPIDIRDATFAQFNPTDNVAQRLLYFSPSTEKLCRLTNVKYDMGTNKSAGTAADTAAIYIVGPARVELENVEVTGHGRGSAMLIINCRAPRVVRPYIHDMIYRYDGDPAFGEQLQGMRFNGCTGSYLEDPYIRQLGGEHKWITGEAIATNRGIQYRWYGDNAYKPTTDGTTGASPPVHTTGTVSDGGVSWLWIGPAEASIRWVGGGLVLGTAAGAVTHGGLIQFVGEGIDVSGSAGVDNADIIFYGTRFEDCDGFGFKLAHAYKRVRLYSVQGIRSGIHNFIFAGGATGLDFGADVKAYDCYSLNPGMVKRWNDTPEELWPISAHYGFGVTGGNPNPLATGKIINCVAIDDQATPTTDYSFRHETANGNWALEDCYGSGFLSLETLGFRTIGFKKKVPAGTALYVRPGGNDANLGFVNDDANAFATIQAAVNAAVKYDLNGQNFTIRIADGTYTAGAALTGILSGQQAASSFTILGNTTTPSNVHVNVASGPAFSVTGGGRMQLNSLKISAAGGNCVDAQNHSVVEVTGVVFGTASARHMSATRNSRIAMIGNCSIEGNAIQHMLLQYGSVAELANRTITIATARAFTQFVSVSGCSALSASAMTFAGAGVAGTTGARYDVSLNGVIVTGAGGANYFPGSTSGAAATGGQYT